MGRTQKELADTISKEMKLSIRQGREFVQRFLDLVTEDLATTERSELRGLGTFAVFVRPARPGVHPVTGEHFTIRERRSIRFRTSKELKEKLNPAPVVVEAKKTQKAKKRQK